jgi:hypothetical protein
MAMRRAYILYDCERTIGAFVPDGKNPLGDKEICGRRLLPGTRRVSRMAACTHAFDIGYSPWSESDGGSEWSDVCRPTRGC